MIFSAQEYRRFNELLDDRAARAADRRERKADRVKRGRAMTSTERVERFRRQHRDIGTVPRVRHRRLREACRFSLLRFGLTYCRAFLAHDPSPEMVRLLIEPLQRIILGGGQEVILFPRSAGKTTWTKIAILWAMLYGHKRFVVCVAATAELADAMMTEVVGALADEDMEALAEDFPGAALPVRACEANPKKSQGILSNGLGVGMKWKGHRFTFPSCRDADGKVLEPSAGSTLVAASIGGSVKGAVKKRERPDLVILDDPQNDKIASSPALTEKAERFIDKSILGLCGQTSIYSLVMTITPMEIGDLASRYCDRDLHGEYHVSRARYVTAWPDEAERSLPGFRAAYRDDVEINDGTWANCREYYRDHQADFAGVKVLDPLNYAPGEPDAVYHLLVMRSRMTDEAFMAEYQMDVTLATSEDAPLTSDEVVKRINGYDMFELPPGTRECVAFCDVNVVGGAGLRYGVAAFGPHRLAAIVGYSRYPRAENQRLYPKGATPDQKKRAIIAGIKAVVREVAAMPLHAAGSSERIHPLALAFDGGFEQDIVATTVKYLGVNAAAEGIDLAGMDILWTKGYSWKHYRDDDKEAQFVKDHCHSSAFRKLDRGGRENVYKYLAIHADYWREIAQGAFRVPYPEPGSCSLWGKSPTRHRKFADELTYEQLVATENQRVGRRTVKSWKWRNVKKGSNHWGDVTYNLFALAHWYQLYSARVSPSEGKMRRATPVGEATRIPVQADAVAANRGLVAPPAKGRPVPIKKPRPLFRKIKRPFSR